MNFNNTFSTDAVPSCNHKMDEWIKFSSKNPYEQIIKSKPFTRLNNISFLGALDYTHSSRIAKEQRTRATHSIHVAALANFISTQRNYSNDLKKHLIIAALLHDIGHPPLSHSVEPYTKEKLGIGHHELSESIVRGKLPRTKAFNNMLRNIVDIDFTLELINQTSTEEGSDLFNSPINIDTIDGIIRSYTYLNGLSPLDPEENRLKIAQASFLESENSTSILADFWSKKQEIYSSLINSKLGLLSDKASELFFKSNNKHIISESDLYTNEKQWQKKYKPLFESLKKIKSQESIPDWLIDETVDYKIRKYFINTDPSIKDLHYSCKKGYKKFNFNSDFIFLNNYKQLPLAF